MTYSTPAAIDVFVSRAAYIRELAGKLVEQADEHFGVSPDDVNWGHVGDLGRIIDLMTRAVSREG